MKLATYMKLRSAIVVAIAVLMAVSVARNSVVIALVAVTAGVVTLSLLRRGLTEVEHDERTVLIHSKASSTTLALTTVAIAIAGLSLIFLSGQGIGRFEQVGYLLAFLATGIQALNALLTYYYRAKLGG
jgi:uncharacterized membrane protein